MNRSLSLVTKQPIVFVTDEHILLCPHCGGDNLHHSLVTVHERPKEDGSGTEHSITPTGFEVRSLTADKMPGRRNQLIIGFKCEQCDDISSLIIKQDEGSTMVFWWLP